MKGMMVSLLVLMMTGTVIGQQPNQPDEKNRPIQYLLDIPTELEATFKEVGLQVSIEPHLRSRIAQFVLRSKNADANLKPAKITQASSFENGILTFKVGDLELQHYETRGVSYDVPASQRGAISGLQIF